MTCSFGLSRATFGAPGSGRKPSGRGGADHRRLARHGRRRRGEGSLSARIDVARRDTELLPSILDLPVDHPRRGKVLRCALTHQRHSRLGQAPAPAPTRRAMHDVRAEKVAGGVQRRKLHTAGVGVVIGPDAPRPAGHEAWSATAQQTGDRHHADAGPYTYVSPNGTSIPPRLFLRCQCGITGYRK